MKSLLKARDRIVGTIVSFDRSLRELESEDFETSISSINILLGGLGRRLDELKAFAKRGRVPVHGYFSMKTATSLLGSAANAMFLAIERAIKKNETND